MRFSYLCLIVLLIGKYRASAQTVPAGLAEKLDNTLDSMLVVIGNKSLSAAMQFDDNSVWKNAVGISSNLTDVTADFKYEIGSITKTLTSACVLQLVDEGLINLDDSIYTWIDTLAFVDSSITIRHLLRHQSGLYEVLANPDMQPQLLLDQDSIWNAKDVITTFIQSPYDVPGSTWSYCNTGYFLLGMIIESVTGNPFYEEIRTRFLDPLELTTVGIPSFETYTGPIAHVWLDITGDGEVDDAHAFFYNWLSLNSSVAAAGGYYGTAADITTWMRTYMRGDLLSASILDEAKETVTAPGLPGTYGLGLIKKTFLGYESFGHGGDLAYSTNSWYLPELDLSVTVFNNDATIISWDLEPVTIALLQTYEAWKLTSPIVENTLATDIKAYPNPFGQSLMVELPALGNNTVQCNLVNMYGQEVWSRAITLEKIPQQYQFEMPASLSNGMYLFEVKENGVTIYSQQLVK